MEGAFYRTMAGWPNGVVGGRRGLLCMALLKN
jgi:hypothetical protein